MKLMIHDLSVEREKMILVSVKNARVISDDGSIRPCVGCFGCWVKTPAQCVVRDRYGDMGAALSKCDELFIISRCSYGGFSPFVKNVLDRSISYLHPYFKIRDGEMHHRRRYNHPFSLSVYFYGDGISGKEKEVARSLVKANSVNFQCTVKDVVFGADPEAFQGAIK